MAIVCAKKTKNKNSLYLLPQSGISLLSAFMTMEDIVMVTGMASKYEEWGARVRMGASAGNALRPFTVIQWKPPANHMTRMMIFRMMSTNLEGRRRADLRMRSELFTPGLIVHIKKVLTFSRGTGVRRWSLSGRLRPGRQKAKPAASWKQLWTDGWGTVWPSSKRSERQKERAEGIKHTSEYALSSWQITASVWQQLLTRLARNDVASSFVHVWFH